MPTLIQGTTSDETRDRAIRNRAFARADREYLRRSVGSDPVAERTGQIGPICGRNRVGDLLPKTVGIVVTNFEKTKVMSPARS